MGLFDNLFLDQNTPITINDGMDRSKDLVVPVFDPNEVEKAHAALANSNDGTKKDDTISDLFESDTKEENHAELVLNPEPPADIALEIGMAPVPESAIPPADPSMAVSDFDIGGDVSFDTLPESNIVTDAENPPSGDPALAVGTNPDGTPITSLDATLAPGSLSGTFLGTTEAAADGTTVPEGTSDAPATPETPAPETASAPIPVDAASAAPEGEGGIFGLIGGSAPTHANTTTPVAPVTPGVEPIAAALPVSTETPTPTDIPTAIESQADLTTRGTLGSLGGSSSEILLGRDALALFTQGSQTSGLLREKLNSFIEDLKSLHSRDQSQRYHKLEQIAMYEERIREIDAEAATRKRVLQAEIDDLKRQIEMMDREKNDIQEVITTFNKELEKS